MERSKSPVTRGALERVLARAAELQTATGDDTDTDALTEEQVLELGREVGLSPEHNRQALAEEGVRVEHPADAGGGLTQRLFGGTRVSTQRAVRGSAERALATLDR